MNKASRLGAATLAVVFALLCAGARPQGAAWGQTLDPRALDALGPAPQAAAPQPPVVRHHRAIAVGTHAHPNGPHQTLPQEAATAPAKPAMQAAIPPAPPPAPVLPPPLVVPTRPPDLPPPPEVASDATGNAVRHGDTLRVTFGVGSADLNPNDAQAVQAMVANPKPSPGTKFNITGYAVGTPDDPSTARRLSLARALAVRSVLMHAGIASADIYVRALGAAPPDATAPPDRVDMALLPAQAASVPPAPAKAATP